MRAAEKRRASGDPVKRETYVRQWILARLRQLRSIQVDRGAWTPDFEEAYLEISRRTRRELRSIRSAAA